MRLIDADEMLVGESRAYMSVQLEMDDFLTRQINKLVHLRIRRLILAMPTIEAEPVRHGKWIEKKKPRGGVFDYSFVCSECHKETPIGAFVISTDYCPFCGARMEKDGEDEQV